MTPRRIGAAGLGLAAACAACVMPGPALRPDRVVAAPAPAPWKRIAVLPFGGAPDLRRPAAELLAVRLREQDRVAVIPPFVVERLLAEGRPRDACATASPAEPPVDGALCEEKRLAASMIDEGLARHGTTAGGTWESWVAASAAAEAPLAAASRPPSAEVRALAAALGADALVAATVVHARTWRVQLLQLGAVVDLVLLDGASGEPVAVLRRRGDSSAARWGEHELAMDAASRAGSDLLEILRTAPGGPAAPAVPEPPTREE